MTAEHINGSMPTDAVEGGLRFVPQWSGGRGRWGVKADLHKNFIPLEFVELAERLCRDELVVRLCACEPELRIDRLDGVRHCVEMVDSEVVEGVLQDVVKVCEVADTLLEALAKAYSAV